MLQCHPYPIEYVDSTKTSSHTAFFMGLQRKQGVKSQESQQFDIRGTVEEFRHEVNLFMFWKPGMEIYVSHVRRKQIPSFVFPNGYQRARPSRPSEPVKRLKPNSPDLHATEDNKEENLNAKLEASSEKSKEDESSEECVHGSGPSTSCSSSSVIEMKERWSKRKFDCEEENLIPVKKSSVSVIEESFSGFEMGEGKNLVACSSVSGSAIVKLVSQIGSTSGFPSTDGLIRLGGMNTFEERVIATDCGRTDCEFLNLVHPLELYFPQPKLSK